MASVGAAANTEEGTNSTIVSEESYKVERRTHTFLTNFIGTRPLDPLHSASYHPSPTLVLRMITISPFYNRDGTRWRGERETAWINEAEVL